MKLRITVFFVLLGLFSLTGCTSMPTGPSVLVLPGGGKNFDQFRSEDYRCRHYAFIQISGVTPSEVSAASGIGSDAIGAGNGMIIESMADGEAAQASGYEAQSRYDISYIQCMYSMGNRVPVSGNLIDENALDENNPPYTAPVPLPPAGK